MSVAKYVGPTVRYRRRALGLTQPALAARAGLHPTEIKHIEAGRRVPRLQTLFQLANSLELTVYEFMVIAEGFQSNAIVDPLAKRKGGRSAK